MAMCHLRLKAGSDDVNGWAAQLMQQGCRVTYAILPFGRTRWAIKKSGAVIFVEQDVHRPCTTSLDVATDAQRDLISQVIATGVATKQDISPRRRLGSSPLMGPG